MTLSDRSPIGSSLGRRGAPPGTGPPPVLLALGSTVVLIAFVLAVPCVLWATSGSPFAHWGMPAAGTLASHARVGSGAVAHWLGRTAALLAWVAWAWMTVCVLVEFRTMVTGRATKKIPASRTLQSVAACLVGTALTLASISRQLPASDGGLRTAPARAIVPAIRVIDDLDNVLGGPGDSAWTGGAVSVSEPYLPTAGHQARSGQADTSSAPLPVRAVEPPPMEPPPKASTSETSGGSHVVSSRETLWSIADDRLGSARRWREIAALNYGLRQADGGELDRRHWIAPGWVLVLPSVREQEPDGSRVVPDPGGQALLGRMETASVSWHEAPPAHPVAPRIPLAPFGAGVVGDGVASLLDRLRRVQQRYRRPGELIRLPAQNLHPTEQRIRMGDGRQIVDDVDMAIRLACRSQWAPLGRIASVTGVRVTEDEIELMTGAAGATASAAASDSGSSDVPQGFRRGQSDGSIMIERKELFGPAPLNVPTDSAGEVAPAPLLVSAGRDPEAIVMVNLEELGVLTVDGDRRACEGFVRGIALELATSRWSGKFDTVLLGFGTEFERFARVMAVSRVAEVVGSLHNRVRRGQVLLQSGGFATFSQARCLTDDHAWDPLVVVCGPDIQGQDVLDVVEITADPGCGAAAVAIGDVPTARHRLSITAEQSRFSMEILGAMVSPQLVDEVDMKALGELFDHASDRRSVARAIAPYDALTVRLPEPPIDGLGEARGDGETDDVAAGDVEGGGAFGADLRHDVESPPSPGVFISSGIPSDDDGLDPVLGAALDPEFDRSPDLEVEVCVLGPIEIRGALRPFTRAWAQELVVYLAMHPKGATNEAWSTALWPERLMAPSSLHSTASVARRALGRGHKGEDHLPRSHGRLCLAPTVGTDWERFVALAEDRTQRSWRSALELVRGRPFEGLRASDWPILEGIAPAIEASVVDVSGRLAGACLSSGNPSGAEWAARKGLLVSPYDERLYRMLMRTADAAGNPSGVEAVMSELVRLVADDIEPFDSVHPSTLELYRSLTRRRVGGHFRPVRSGFGRSSHDR